MEVFAKDKFNEAWALNGKTDTGCLMILVSTIYIIG